MEWKKFCDEKPKINDGKFLVCNIKISYCHYFWATFEKRLSLFHLVKDDGPLKLPLEVTHWMLIEEPDKERFNG